MDSVQTHYVIKVKHADSLRRLTLVKQPGGDSGLSFAELEAKILQTCQISESSKLKLTYLDKDKDTVTLENDDDLKDACIYQGLNPLHLDVVLAPTKSNFPGEPSRASSFKAPISEGLEEPLKEILSTLRPENVKSMFETYEPLFRDVRHPSQIPDLLENVVKTIASQFAPLNNDTGVGNEGASTSAAATTDKDQNMPQDGAPQVQGPGSEAVHYGVSCDGCQKSPITGVRYKSTVKENYDLCSSCHAKTGAPAGEYIIVARPVFVGRHFHRGRMIGPSPWGTMSPMSRHPQCGMRASHDWLQGGRLDGRFVRDVSIFDGTQLAPGTRFTKIWRLRNSGAVPWPANTKLVNVHGDDLGSAAVTPLAIGEQGLAPEEEIEVSADCVAPQRTGRYKSVWRLATPWGPKFGHKLWVQIQVVPSDTLNQPAQVDADEELIEVEGTSAAEGSVQGDQIREPSTVVPAELGTSDDQAKDVGPSTSPPGSVKDMAGPEEMKDVEGVMLNTGGPERMSDVGSDSMKDMEESFVKVDVNNDGDKTPVIQMTEMPLAEATRPDEAVNAPVEVKTTDVPVDKSAESAEAATDGEEGSTDSPLLVKLEAMGFTDRALNVQLLKENAFDLRKTVDALCEVEEWAPALVELAEMGFNDVDLNRRIMFKYGGNLKRVVKELVQLAKYNA
ncbi:hypothetical protein R1flu_004134 [Riccia fluitans]|uniref:ZZ-type domain-containing protein n=1 Tax=Riccia fluitans TaxID=41844 RepID=A0ABD1YPT2_9MARC